MAQADSVPSSSRQLITGESANQSTNVGAINLPAVLTSRRDLVGGSDARVIMRRDETPLHRLGLEKPGEEPEDLLKSRYYGQAPVGSNIEALFLANVAFFLGWLLRRIVRILLLLVGMNKRLRNGAPDKMSSNQLVPSRPQGRMQ